MEDHKPLAFGGSGTTGGSVGTLNLDKSPIGTGVEVGLVDMVVDLITAFFAEGNEKFCGLRTTPVRKGGYDEARGVEETGK